MTTAHVLPRASTQHTAEETVHMTAEDPAQTAAGVTAWTATGETAQTAAKKVGAYGGRGVGANDETNGNGTGEKSARAAVSRGGDYRIAADDGRQRQNRALLQPLCFNDKTLAANVGVCGFNSH